MPTTEQGIQALVTKPSGEGLGNWKPLFEELPLDPWGRPYIYRNPGRNNLQGFDLFSLGPDGVESDDDIGKNTKN